MTKALAVMPTQPFATMQVNGSRVSLYAPPHSEPDLPWIDLRELLAATSSPKVAGVMVRVAAALTRPNYRPVVSTQIGALAVELVSYLTAQVLCETLDELEAGDTDPGPITEVYVDAFGSALSRAWPLTDEQFIAAVKNIGGPFARSSH